MAVRRAAGVCLVAAALLTAGCGGSAKHAATTTAKPKRLPARWSMPNNVHAVDFALGDQNGRLVRLSGDRGRLVLLTFLYTQCKDVCPLIATHLDTAVRDLGHEASSVRVLAVSVDPNNDTRRAVRTYVQEHRLGTWFHWLIGTRDQLAPVWRAYNVLVEAQTPEKIAHAAPIVLIDRDGMSRFFYQQNVTTSVVEQDLRRLLRAGA